MGKMLLQLLRKRKPYWHKTMSSSLLWKPLVCIIIKWQAITICEAPFTVISLFKVLLSPTLNGLPPGPVKGGFTFLLRCYRVSYINCRFKPSIFVHCRKAVISPSSTVPLRCWLCNRTFNLYEDNVIYQFSWNQCPVLTANLLLLMLIFSQPLATNLIMVVRIERSEKLGLLSGIVSGVNSFIAN